MARRLPTAHAQLSTIGGESPPGDRRNQTLLKEFSACRLSYRRPGHRLVAAGRLEEFSARGVESNRPRSGPGRAIEAYILERTAHRPRLESVRNIKAKNM